MLPTWDLNHIYTSEAELWADLSDADTKSISLRDSYKDKLSSLGGGSFVEMVESYEGINETLSKASTFSFLQYSCALSDSNIIKLHQDVTDKINAISRTILFVSLEIRNMSELEFEELLSSGEDSLKAWRQWLLDLRRMTPYLLSTELEDFILENTPTAEHAWVRLFDETISNIRFSFGEESLTLTQILNCLSNADGEVRKEAAASIGRELRKHAHIFTLITNTLSKAKDIEDSRRGLGRPDSARNISNLIEDEVVDCLIGSIEDNYSKLSHRYYELKARVMGQEKLNHWDRQAPLSGLNDKEISWKEAKDTIIQAYGDFSPQMAEITSKFFDNNWIHGSLEEGKMSGAFAHPCVPSVHPYILTNYQGKIRDVLTLAHELGHGVHQYLASSQGLLKSRTPLTLAETASVFGEMLVFEKILEDAQGSLMLPLLASKIEDKLNTVTRQCSFYRFEWLVHKARQQGEITTAQLNEMWLKVGKDSLGKVFDFDDDFPIYWTYVPHFIHAPFYVYAYSFGECLVNSLFRIYKGGGQADFVQKYMHLLQQGGSQNYDKLLRPFDINVHKSDFWQEGLSLIQEYIDKMEELV